MIIIVSHAAAGERKSIGKRRLFNARLFLTAITTKARPVERILITEGEMSSGRGYLDFSLPGLSNTGSILPRTETSWFSRASPRSRAPNLTRRGTIHADESNHGLGMTGAGLSETDQTGRKLKTFVPANGTTLAEQELVTIGIRQ
ncbi:MAG: hypothetical protein IPK58_08520 [Acidobacteria bacterium]|nr:hypothetical protein [Acidobacteriota bacterium]